MQSSMHERNSKVSDQLSKRRTVNINAEARDMLWAVCPPGIHDNRKSWLARAARLLGFGHRRTKAIFYCEARVITAHEWRVLNERLDALKNAEKRHGEQTHELELAYRSARESAPDHR